MLLFFLLFPYPFVLATCYWDACTWYFLNSMVFQYNLEVKVDCGLVWLLSLLWSLGKLSDFILLSLYVVGPPYNHFCFSAVVLLFIRYPYS